MLTAAQWDGVTQQHCRPPRDISSRPLCQLPEFPGSGQHPRDACGLNLGHLWDIPPKRAILCQIVPSPGLWPALLRGRGRHSGARKQKGLESSRRGRGHQNINRPGKGRLHFGFSLMWLTNSYEKLEVKSKCLYASYPAPRLFSHPWGMGEKTASCVNGDATLCGTYMCWTE